MKIDYDVGDVVVCVDASPHRSEPKAHLLRVGGMYRVAVIEDCEPFGGLGVAFWSLKSDIPGKGWAWRVGRFRKLPKAPEHEADFIRRIAKPKERVRDREEV